ncbi:polysaccharide pyruvyl transferase family protein [Breznakiellaceae bacterium SP9]
MNVGDVVLYNRLEKVFDNSVGYENIWYHRLAFGEITAIEAGLINKTGKLVIVGGHGLLMPDSNENSNSGWGFNISIKNLEQISIPIVFFAIGYNVFRGEYNFRAVFSQHIGVCIDKSVFFGLRNYGSINKVKRFLPEKLHDKIKYQPCPTTITALYSKKSRNRADSTNEIVISVAFNRFNDRFGENYRKVFKQLLKYCETIKNLGYTISLCGHHILDTHSKYANYFKKQGFPIAPLYKYSEENIYKYYENKKMVIGMRGHSLMIPFGLTIPILSLTNHDKQKWFIETTGHNEWNIEMDGDFYEKLIEATIAILQNYDYVKNEIIKIQKINKEFTLKNINYIKGLMN